MVAPKKNGSGKPSKKTTVTKECIEPPPSAPQPKTKKEQENPFECGPSRMKRMRHYATKPLEFEITEEDVKNATCGDPRACVVAQALTRKLQDFFDWVEVGSRTTKVICSDRVISYRTSEQLSRGIIVFDATGNWFLKPGWYYLNRDEPSKNRWKLVKKSKGQGTKKKEQSVFRPKAVASRRVVRIDALLAGATKAECVIATTVKK